jgi:lysophospholipase L1-like esterase
LATIWFGTNDAIKPGYPQHVPLDEFKRNMTEILETHFDQVDVLLITPTTVVVPNTAEGHEDDTLHVQYGQTLAQIADEVNQRRRDGDQSGASDKKVVLVNMHALFIQAVQRTPGGLAALFQADGMHISSLGYKVVFDGLLAAIASELPHLMPDRLPYIVPEWKTINLSADAQGQSEQLEPKRRLTR